jgi:hypothetical protein
MNDATLKAKLIGRVRRFRVGFFIRLKPLPRRLRGLSTSGSQEEITAAG